MKSNASQDNISQTKEASSSQISNQQLSKDADDNLAEGSDHQNSPPKQDTCINSGDNGSDSDEAPEVVSIVAGKRQIKQKEEEIDKFAKATARARRQANRIRDEKLKLNSKARKTKLTTKEIEQEEQPSSSSAEEDDNPEDDDGHDSSNKSTSAPIPTNTKKYLDPSLFASASNILHKSQQASLARQAEQSSLIKTRKKKQKKVENHDWKDLGNNTTVVHLSQTDHLNPSPRPLAAANFARNRLYTKPGRSAIKLPKATLVAKAEMGARISAFETTLSRRTLKPALVFSRPHQS